eukprot:Hpha_TRINITY_DN15730_c3_g3::TRINITY_DN15730_c3_g3_i1::g.38041::m.38041
MGAFSLFLGVASMSASVVELQCAKECTNCAVGTTWEENKCLPVGNAPPYPNSQIVSVKNGQAVFTAYKGDSCLGPPTQVQNQSLDSCAYFVGSLWTIFKEHTNSTLKSCTEEDAALWNSGKASYRADMKDCASKCLAQGPECVGRCMKARVGYTTTCSDCFTNAHKCGAAEQCDKTFTDCSGLAL